jgi:hypothetical protein
MSNQGYYPQQQPVQGYVQPAQYGQMPAQPQVATGYPPPQMQQPYGQPQLPQQPQQPYGQPQQPQQPQQPYGQPQPMGQPMPGALPPCHAIDDEAMAAAYRKTKEEMQRGGGGANFLKVLGPQGQTKWDHSVPIGYEGKVNVHICRPWAPNRPLYQVKRSYFWKSRSKPQGASITVTEGQDLIAQAMELGKESSDPAVRKFVDDFGRARTNYLYNVLWLDNPQAHYGADGLMRPFILDAGKQLHAAIGDVFSNAEGASAIVDYEAGRPVRILRRKTGPQPMDIEWAASAALNASPVPQPFWAALHNLWNLDEFVKGASVEDVQKAILEMGLPMPGQQGAVQVQVPQAYPPPAQPQYPPPAQPQYQPPAQPQYQPPAQPQYQPMQPQGYPPPAQPMQPQYAPAPPPVTSSGGPVVASAGPPPVPMGPNPGVAANAAQAASLDASEVSSPVPQGTHLVEGMQIPFPVPQGVTFGNLRERCFGQHSTEDNFCRQCEGWIRDQCVRVTPQAGTGLQQLQAQMVAPQG